MFKLSQELMANLKSMIVGKPAPIIVGFTPSSCSSCDGGCESSCYGGCYGGCTSSCGGNCGGTCSAYASQY